MSDSVTKELGKLFEKLESVAKETKLEEKKKIDYVEQHSQTYLVYSLN